MIATVNACAMEWDNDTALFRVISNTQVKVHSSFRMIDLNQNNHPSSQTFYSKHNSNDDCFCLKTSESKFISGKDSPQLP